MASSNTENDAPGRTGKCDQMSMLDLTWVGSMYFKYMAKQSKRFLTTRPLLPFIPGNPIEKCRTAQEKPASAPNFEYIHVAAVI